MSDRRLTNRILSLRDEPVRRVVLRSRVMAPYWRRRFLRFGEGSILHRPDWVFGAHKITIGDRVVILKSIWLSAERSSWETQGPAIEIGDRTGIRPYCTISASESIVIEEDVVIAAFTTLIDSDHVHGGRTENIVYGGKKKTSPIRVGRGTWIGERVAVLRGSNIGRFCTIGANSVVRGDIPDYSVAVGAPARVVGSTLEDIGSET